MRDVTKLGLRLFIFTLIAALALAVTNEITSGPIAQQELAAGQAAQRAVLPEAEIFETQEIQTAPEYDQITELYVGKTGDEVVGYVMTASPQGYGGPIPITLGIGADGSIHGVSVGDLQETAGLGSKVGEEPFTSQFPGGQFGNCQQPEDSCLHSLLSQKFSCLQHIIQQIAVGNQGYILPLAMTFDQVALQSIPVRGRITAFRPPRITNRYRTRGLFSSPAQHILLLRQTHRGQNPHAGNLP